MEHSLLVHSEFFIHLFLFGNEDMDRGLVVFFLYERLDPQVSEYWRNHE